MVAESSWTPPGMDPLLPSPVQELHDESLTARQVRVFLKRDDLIHPELPGNKWRKLKYNLAAAAASGQHTLLTFGGAYSNHIRAVAAAGRHLGFATIGVIRGEEHLPLNPEASVRRYLRATQSTAPAGPVAVQSVRVCVPAEQVAELAAVIGYEPRTRALAARFEQDDRG